jgi:hypothetical protein
MIIFQLKAKLSARDSILKMEDLLLQVFEEKITNLFADGRYHELELIGETTGVVIRVDGKEVL